MPGVELGHVWRKMPRDAKMELARTLANCSTQLCTKKFDNIGSLYLAGWEERRQNVQVEHEPVKTESKGNYQLGSGGTGFTVGPVVLPFFFSQRRLYIPCDRGLYATSRDYLRAKVHLQTLYVSTEIDLLRSVKDEVLDGLDEDYLKDRGYMRKFSEDHLRACDNVPIDQPPTSGGPFILCHEHLNQGNILVDPSTVTLTAIIDREMILILPL